MAAFDRHRRLATLLETVREPFALMATFGDPEAVMQARRAVISPKAGRMMSVNQHPTTRDTPATRVKCLEHLNKFKSKIDRFARVDLSDPAPTLKEDHWTELLVAIDHAAAVVEKYGRPPCLQSDIHPEDRRWLRDAAELMFKRLLMLEKVAELAPQGTTTHVDRVDAELISPPNGPILAPTELRALEQYQEAIRRDPAISTDEQAYAWVKEHRDDSTPPKFDSWRRKLSAARNKLGLRKNTPRAGRTSRSIVRIVRASGSSLR